MITSVPDRSIYIAESDDLYKFFDISGGYDGLQRSYGVVEMLFDCSLDYILYVIVQWIEA